MEEILPMVFHRLIQPHVFAFAGGLAIACRLRARQPGPSRCAAIGFSLLLCSSVGCCLWDAYSLFAQLHGGDRDDWANSMSMSRSLLSWGYAAGAAGLLAAVYAARSWPPKRQPQVISGPADSSGRIQPLEPAVPVMPMPALSSPHRSSPGDSDTPA
jgi:hypothetical protein